MTYKHSNLARELKGIFDSATQRHIMIEAAHLADWRGTLRYSQQQLADALLLTRATVWKEFQKLEAKGLIIATGSKTHKEYQINLVDTKENKVAVLEQKLDELLARESKRLV